MDIMDKINSFLSSFQVRDALEKDVFTKEYQHQPLSHYLHPAAFDENGRYYICRDNTIGFLFECFPKILAGEDTVRVLQGLYASPNFPENTLIQVMLWASDFIEPFVNAFSGTRRTGTQNEAITSWTNSASEFLLNQKRYGSIPEVPVPIRNYRLVISIKLPYHVNELEDKARHIDFTYRTCKSALETANLYPELVDPEQYLRLMFPILNPNHDRTSYPIYEKDRYIYQQLIDADTDMYIGRNYVKYDGVYGKAVTIKQFPEEVSISDTLFFLGDLQRNEVQITCPYMVTLTLYNPGDKIRTDQEKKAEFLYKQKLASSMSVKLTKKQEEAAYVIEKLVDGNKLMKGFITWWLYHDELDTVMKNSELLKSLLDIKGYKLQEEIRSVNLGLFLYATLPLNGNKESDNVLKRGRTMFDFNCAHLSPVQADWKGTGTPTVYFKSRRGQLQFFSFFDGSEGFNGIVAAQTGAGKSFLTQHIIYSYYSLPNISNIWTIDVGESYKALCTLLGGQYVDFREDTEYIINPFSECDDLDEDMDLFIALLAKMAKPTEAITDTEKSVVEQAIRETFSEQGKGTSVDHIIDKLRQIQAETDTQDFAKKQATGTMATNLYRWGSEGQYGKYFNGKSNLNLQDRFVVLELKNISHRDDLKNVILMVLFYHISRVVYMEDDRTKRKMIIFDEAWQFLHDDDPKISKFLEKVYRTARKHGASAITVTQSIDDFYHNESTKALMTQASYWLLLKQKPESINLLREEKKIALSDYEFELLESVKTIKGLYSEIFFHTPLGRGIGRLILPRFLYWLYTTDAAEVAKRAQLIEQHGFRGGIEKCVELYG